MDKREYTKKSREYRDEYSKKKNIIDKEYHEKIEKLDEEYIKSNQPFPVGSKVKVTYLGGKDWHEITKDAIVVGFRVVGVDELVALVRCILKNGKLGATWQFDIDNVKLAK